VIVQRAVDLEPAAVRQRLDDLLVGQHQLRRERTWPQAMQWRRRTDPLGWMQRTIRDFSGRAPLGRDERRLAVRPAIVRAPTHTRGSRPTQV